MSFADVQEGASTDGVLFVYMHKDVLNKEREQVRQETRDHLENVRANRGNAAAADLDIQILNIVCEDPYDTSTTPRLSLLDDKVADLAIKDSAPKPQQQCSSSDNEKGAKRRRSS